jgi:hypothetical protein
MAVSNFFPSVYSFNTTFAGIPVEIQYEIEVNADHHGRDVAIIPTACVIGDHAVDLCEDAGFFHPEQLKTWLAEAESHYKDDGDDNREPADHTDSAWAAAAAEDQWMAQRDRAHYAHAGR